MTYPVYAKTLIATTLRWLPNMLASVIGDKHPASWSLIGDRPTNISPFSMIVMTVNVSTQ